MTYALEALLGRTSTSAFRLKELLTLFLTVSVVLEQWDSRTSSECWLLSARTRSPDSHACDGLAAVCHTSEDEHASEDLGLSLSAGH